MERSRSGRRQEVDGYEIVSVDIERKVGYGETVYSQKISEDGDVLCVVYKRFEELGIHVALDGKRW